MSIDIRFDAGNPAEATKMLKMLMVICKPSNVNTAKTVTPDPIVEEEVIPTPPPVAEQTEEPSDETEQTTPTEAPLINHDERDKAGNLWDARIHGAQRKQTAKGIWNLFARLRAMSFY